MTQNGSNIDFVYDIYFTLSSCRFWRSSDDDTVNQFVAHLSGKFRGFKVLLDIPYKLVGALYSIRRFCEPLFKHFFQPFAFKVAKSYALYTDP